MEERKKKRIEWAIRLAVIVLIIASLVLILPELFRLLP